MRGETPQAKLSRYHLGAHVASPQVGAPPKAPVIRVCCVEQEPTGSLQRLREQEQLPQTSSKDAPLATGSRRKRKNESSALWQTSVLRAPEIAGTIPSRVRAGQEEKRLFYRGDI